MLGITAKGEFVDLSPELPTMEKLGGQGNLVLKPSEHDWGEGYYYFDPHINKGDRPVTGKFLWWLEH
jgi:hypothetical protein